MPGTGARPVDAVQYSLNNGEISYRYEARGDHPRYMQSVARAENWLPVVVGGMRFRDGLAFDGHTKNDGFVRLIPFIFNKYESYIVELGDFYARFRYKDGTPVMAGAVPLEIALPYTLAEMLELDYAQSADVMYTFHINHKVQKILRVALDDFRTNEVNFQAPGTILDEPTGEDLGMGTLTPGATSGPGVTFTSQNPGFVTADRGRGIRYLGSRALIRSVTDASHVVADIIDPFPDTNPIPADQWRLTGTPDGNVDVSHKRKGNLNTLNFSVSGAVRPRDVGSYVRVFGGFIKIVEYVSPTQVNGLIVVDLHELDPDPSVPIVATEFWTLWRPAWTTDFGFPSCGTFGQNRFYLGRNLTIWGSLSADIENFGLGSGDEDGINREILDDEVNDLQWLAWIKKSLKAGTIGGEFEASATTEGGAVTPTDFNINHITADGTAKIKPVRAQGKILFVQFGSRRLRALNFNWLDQEIESPDLLSLADHLTEAETRQITAIAYQHEPQSLVWCVLGDGTMIVMLFDPTEKVVAWGRVDTNGCIISVAVIPAGDTGRDRVFIAVQRTNGVFIEHFDADRIFQFRPWKGFSTDSAVFRIADVNGVITNLGHLEGQTVRVIGNGLLYDDAVVTGGQLTVTIAGAVPPEGLDPTIEYEVGLPIQNNELHMLEPPIPPNLGGPAVTRGWAKIGVRFRKSLGLKLGVILREEGFRLVNQLEFRQADDPRFETPPLKRGKLSTPSRGHDSIGRIVIKQDLPYPAEVLSVYGLLSIGDQWKDEIFDDTEEVAAPCAPVPPPPPTCPEEPTVTHIDSGFTLIQTGTWSLDQTNLVVYYGGSQSGNQWITKFDMDAGVVRWETNGNGFIWFQPAVDPINGDVYVRDHTAGVQAMSQIDPADGSLIRTSGNTFDFNLTPKITANTIYLAFSSPGLNRLTALNKSDLSIRWTTNTPGSALGVGNRISGICVDGTDDVWIHTHQSGTGANSNVLIKFDETTGAGTVHDITAAFPSGGTFQNISFDPINNTIIVSGGGTAKFQLPGFGLTVISALSLLDNGNAINGIVDGKIWFNTASALEEYDAVSGSLLRTILKTDIVGGDTVTSWAQIIMMLSLNCLHLNHGTFPSHPIGGVDKICIACPTVLTGGPLSRTLLLGGRQQQQGIPRGPFLVQ